MKTFLEFKEELDEGFFNKKVVSPKKGESFFDFKGRAAKELGWSSSELNDFLYTHEYDKDNFRDIKLIGDSKFRSKFRKPSIYQYSLPGKPNLDESIVELELSEELLEGFKDLFKQTLKPEKGETLSVFKKRVANEMKLSIAETTALFKHVGGKWQELEITVDRVWYTKLKTYFKTLVIVFAVAGIGYAMFHGEPSTVDSNKMTVQQQQLLLLQQQHQLHQQQQYSKQMNQQSIVNGFTIYKLK